MYIENIYILNKYTDELGFKFHNVSSIYIYISTFRQFFYFQIVTTILSTLSYAIEKSSRFSPAARLYLIALILVARGSHRKHRKS